MPLKFKEGYQKHESILIFLLKEQSLMSCMNYTGQWISINGQFSRNVL